MRVTRRDIQLVRDIALSHLMSRDQAIRLGYFGSITRANTRMRELRAIGALRRLDCPFHGQALHMAGPKAAELCGERIAPLLAGRAGSPRFVRHALAVTNIRVRLLQNGADSWRFEQQLWRELDGRAIRPDGLALGSGIPVFVEADLGHAAPGKVREKLLGYRALSKGDSCQALYGFPEFRVLIATTGIRRSRRLRSLLDGEEGFGLLVHTFWDLGVDLPGSWS